MRKLRLSGIALVLGLLFAIPSLAQPEASKEAEKKPNQPSGQLDFLPGKSSLAAPNCWWWCYYSEDEGSAHVSDPATCAALCAQACGGPCDEF